MVSITVQSEFHHFRFEHLPKNEAKFEKIEMWIHNHSNADKYTGSASTQIQGEKLHIKQCCGSRSAWIQNFLPGSGIIVPDPDPAKKESAYK